jgi:hypothetical protein
MWRNGRLASLRGWCSQGRAGSNPAMVTKKAIKIAILQCIILIAFVLKILMY